jgi:hypothetical protein
MGDLKERLSAKRPKAEDREERTVEHFENLLAKAIGGADRFDIAIVQWPGREDVKVGLRLLSDYDVAAADNAARAWAREHEIEHGRERMDEREFVAVFTAETLARVLVDPDTKQALVRSADELRKLATREELTKLGEALSDHQEASAPSPYSLTDDEIDKLVSALKKAPAAASATLLQRCAPSTLRRCITSLADQLRKQATTSSEP